MTSASFAEKSYLSIALFTPAWPSQAYPNGIIPYVEILSDRFEAMGHRITILSNALSGELTDPRVRLVARECSDGSLSRRLVDSVSYRLDPAGTSQRICRRDVVNAFRRIVAEQQIQCIEMEETCGWSWWVQKATRVPMCVRLHGPWFLNGKASGVSEDDAFRKRVANEGRAIASADLITSPSQDTLDQTREYYKLALPNAFVIPAPLPVAPATNRWQLDACDPKLVGFVGRFDRHKGADVLIDAFAKVLQQVPDAKLRCIGAEKTIVDDNGREWKPAEYIRDRIPGALELGAVQFLGHQPKEELLRLRREALVTVVPSRYEIFGYTATEAMSLGSPIVGSRTGGIKGFIQDGSNGLLHEPGNVHDLSEKIVSLLNDPERAARLGAQARLDAEERFSSDRIATRLIELYRTVLRDHSA